MHLTPTQQSYRARLTAESALAVRPNDVDARRAPIAAVRAALAACGMSAADAAALDDAAARDELEDTQFDGFADGCRA